MPYRSLAGLMLAGLLTLAGCAQRPTTPTLYAELGGEPGLETIVEGLLYRIAEDDRIVGFFANTNIDHFAAALEQQLCAISDGPCRYEGPAMARAHQHMGLTDAHFNAVVEHLRRTLIEEDIPTGPRNRLLGRLAPLHAEIMRLQ